MANETSKTSNPSTAHDSATPHDATLASRIEPQPAAAAVAAADDVTETDLAVPQPVGESACRRITHLVEAIREDELPRINANLNLMTITAWGAMPRIKAMRPLIVANMPKHDLTLFDAFEDIVLSLSYTDAVVRASTEERRELKLQAEAVEEYRRVLFDVGTGLARAKLIDARTPEKVSQKKAKPSTTKEPEPTARRLKRAPSRATHSRVKRSNVVCRKTTSRAKRTTTKMLRKTHS